MTLEDKLNKWRNFLITGLRETYDEWIQLHLIRNLEDATLENPSEYLIDIWDFQDRIDEVDYVLDDLEAAYIDLDTAESNCDLSDSAIERHYDLEYLRTVLENIRGLEDEGNEIIDDLESYYGEEI